MIRLFFGTWDALHQSYMRIKEDTQTVFIKIDSLGKINLQRNVDYGRRDICIDESSNFGKRTGSCSYERPSCRVRL
jgi:hypothetical protein